MAPRPSSLPHSPRDKLAGRPLSSPRPTKQSLITDFFSHRGAHKSSARTTKDASRVTKPRKPARKSHIKLLGPFTAHTTLSAHRTAISASPLLSLPPEIRTLIWRYAMTAPSGCLHYSTSQGRFDVSGIGTGLLTTCHFVALETTFLLLRLNRLVFERVKREERGVLKMWGKVIALGGRGM